jgi:hypothetical protein
MADHLGGWSLGLFNCRLIQAPEKSYSSLPRPLPFRDSEVDIVISNAVVEHVCNRRQQAEFMSDLSCVAKAFFVTTPNRWFPVEHHTGLPLLHYLPGPLFRPLIRGAPLRLLDSEQHLNILTGRELLKILPPTASLWVERIKLFGIASNLVPIGRRL